MLRQVAFAVAMLMVASEASAGLVGVIGDDWFPPASLGPYSLTEFPADSRPTFQFF